MNPDRTKAGLVPLVLGLVGPVGSGLDSVQSAVREVLQGTLGYENVIDVRVSDCVDELAPEIWKRVWAAIGTQAPGSETAWKYDGDPTKPPKQKAPEHIRRKALMDAARVLREDSERSDALALLALRRATELREANMKNGGRSVAIVLRSLKHPDEVTLLRNCLGPSFLLVGGNTSRSRRETALRRQLKPRGTRDKDIPAIAQYLMRREEDEGGFGQRLADTYHLADCFVDTEKNTKLDIERFLRLVFGAVDISPRQDEFGLFLARVAAATSGSLARQVGAAVLESRRGVSALGWNEAPCPGGGLLFDDDIAWRGLRDKTEGVETSHTEKTRNAEEICDALALGSSTEDLVEKLKSTRVMAALEFYRELHAEAAALLCAARRGISTQDGTLYVTTFPCHDCAKLIIASGVKRVVYLEPYEKSKTLSFYSEAFEDGRGDGIRLEPFVGVGPRCYLDLFSLVGSDGLRRERKDGEGNSKKWKPLFRWKYYPTAIDEQFHLADIKLLEEENLIKRRDDARIASTES